MSTKQQNNKKTLTKIDSLVYWLVQIAFACFTAAGLYHYLEPVDPVLSLPLATLFVGMLFYISIKNR